MKLRNSGAELFIPDGKPVDEAVGRTTHMGISAHQDDLEIMAYHGILLPHPTAPIRALP